MQLLKVDWLTHTPAGKDGTRTSVRSKGKVVYPLWTVKEAHETLYQFINRRQRCRTTYGYGTILIVTIHSVTAAKNTPDRRTGWQIPPRDAVRNMCSRELFIKGKAYQYPVLQSLISTSSLNLKEIEIHWRGVLHLVTSIKQGAVTASLMLKKFSSYPKQKG
jgi:hypothetical protein